MDDDRNNFISRVVEYQSHMLVSLLPNLTFNLFSPSNPGTDVLSAALLRKDVETLRLLIQQGAQLDGLLSIKETDNIIALGSILKERVSHSSAENITTDQKPETSASSPIGSSVTMFPEKNKRKGKNNQNCQSDNYKKPRT